MNQPPNPVPPRGARPQLFNAPSSTTVNAKRHADFGPSILATIDGGQSRFGTPRDRQVARRVLWIGTLALVVVAAYLGVRFSGERAGPTAQAVVVEHAPPPAAPVVLKAVDPAASAASSVVAQGAAAIETVTPVAVAASAAAASSAPSVATSLNNIQLALDRSEPVPLVKKQAAEKAPNKDVVKHRGAAPATPSAERPATRAGTAPDTDAELLAAMLPHLKRRVSAPTSPAYEKRCGQLRGDAALDCRAKFCNGRQGVDAACPAASPASR